MKVLNIIKYYYPTKDGIEPLVRIQAKREFLFHKAFELAAYVKSEASHVMDAAIR